jgi:lysophospholipase L1-like esterase
VKITDRDAKGVLGFSGVRFQAASSGAMSRFELGGSRQAEVFFTTDPQGGTLEVRVDGRPAASLFTRGPKQELAVAPVPLPSHGKQLELVAKAPGVSVLGVSLETGRPGVVYDSVGLPGAMAEVYLRADESSFTSHLRRRSPSLVVVMVGGNEAYEIGRGWSQLDKAAGQLARLIQRLQSATPEASCLVMAPLDAGVESVGGQITPREHSRAVGRAFREVALGNGCAFWDAQEAMGGQGSVAQWLEVGLMHADLVHPKARGADLLGHLFDFALERARIARPERPPLLLADAAGLEGAQGPALDRFFTLLGEAAKGRGGAVRVVQLGASHTAAHMFTDEVRGLLTRKFGSAGRGFISAGKSSPRLQRSKVRRALSGEWSVLDARQPGQSDSWGPSGIRAVGQPGASMAVTFEEEPSGAPAGTLSLHYLEAPGMGRMEIRVNGQLLAQVPAEGARPAERAAKILSFPVKGGPHKLEVRNTGGGPISLFGVALDLERPGVIYDAIGLPGSTVMLFDRISEGAYVEQLRARRADLYVVFFGTNESAITHLDPEAYRQHNLSLLRKLRMASPEAECLLIGPTDRLKRREDGRQVQAQSIEQVMRVLREVADAEGCAFWSARAAMGGPRSMARWQRLRPPLGHDDGVHLTEAGYQMLARGFADELIRAYTQAARPQSGVR